MRWLIIHANPDPNSFSAALRDQALASLASSGHDVRLIDLYGLGFNPNFTADEHRNYLDVATDHPDPLVRAHIELLRWAEGLVFVYPTWWATMPAMLKGWVDRTFLPHVAFTLDPKTQRVTPTLSNIRRLVGITTTGSPTWRVRLLGDGGKTTIGRTVRLVCHRRVKVSWHVLGAIHGRSATERAQFLSNVDRSLRGLQ